MLKRILLSITLFATAVVYTQQLPLLSEIEGDKKTSANASFLEDVQRLETYFSTRDIAKKGSGYKPFKRWEYHWSQYLQKDGTIAPAKDLWKAWEEKRKMSKRSKVTSNWTSVGPFSQSSKRGQGRVNAIAEDPNDPNTIYVGAPAGGLWKSTNGGINWTPLTDHLPQIGVSGIAIDPNNSNIIYISTGDDDGADSYSIGVMKSTDGGATWDATGELADNPILSNEIFIDPTNSNIVWVATFQGLYKSIDAGVSWVRKYSGYITDFRLKPGDPNTVYAVSGGLFLYSNTGGTTFESRTVGNGLPDLSEIGRLRIEVSSAPGTEDNVYILAVGPGPDYKFKGVYKSTNSGLDFTRTQASITFGSNQAWYDLAFAVSPTNPDEMLLGVLDMWRSTNDGENFLKINSWRVQNAAYTHADIHFIRYFGNTIYVGSDGGIYKSTNSGGSFTDLTENLAISQFYRVSVSKQSSSSMAGGLQDNGGFALNSNTWHNYHGADGMDAAADPNNEGTFYGFTQFGRILNRTSDGGLSSDFSARSPSAIRGNWITPLAVTKTGAVFAGYDQLYKLEGRSWTTISSHDFGENIWHLEIDPSNNDNIYVSIRNTLFISTDGGSTFVAREASQTGIDGSGISSLEVHSTNSNIIWLTTWGTGNFFDLNQNHVPGGVYKSIDGGLTFTDISEGLPNEPKTVIRHRPFSTNNAIYLGTALGVYHRNDDTNTWEVFSTNLPNVHVSDIEINPYDNTITAATYGRSVWQSPIPTIPIPDNDIDLLSIKSPQNNVICGTIAPKLSILNNGASAVTSLAIQYNLDGNANEVFNWTGNIAPNASMEIEIPPVFVDRPGFYTLNTEIVQNDDANLFNNSATTSFFLSNIGRTQTTYTFGDENPAANENNNAWTVSDNNLWQIGTPTSTQLNGLVTSGYVTNPSGNYPDQTISYLTSPCYNLSLLENPLLSFDMAFELQQNKDILYVEYSTDRGTTWQLLGTSNDSNWYNSNSTPADNCTNCLGAQWTGTEVELKEYSYDLSSLNNELTVVFRFVFVSDQVQNEEGVVIDNFKIDGAAVLSVNDFEKGDFLIYPNPSKDRFNIKRTTAIGEQMQLKVYDITGKLLREKSNIVSENYQLDMKGVSKGIYFLELSIDNKKLVKKLVLN